MSPKKILAEQYMPTVVLLKGLKRSGKDYIAKQLVDQISKPVHTYSFAYPLKDIICKTLDITPDKLDKYKNESTQLLAVEDSVEAITDFRTLLQKFGTEAMKPWFGEDVWVNLFLKQHNPEYLYIIPDWRFPTEYNVLKKHFNIITIEVLDRNLKPDNHSSETALQNFQCDYIIDNTAKDGKPIPYLAEIATKLNKGTSWNSL